MLPGAHGGLLHQILGALAVAVAEPEEEGEERSSVVPLQCGEFMLGGRRVGEGGSGRHGRMAPQGGMPGQGPHRDLRRTVDRVDERFDERFRTPLAAVRAATRRAPDGLMEGPGLFGGGLSFVPICA
jgi:hypothetical protein